VVVILDNVRSVFNVGSIFRTSDAVGISKIYLVGCTPAPKDRFGRARSDLAKVALGAEKNIPWQAEKNIQPLLKKLKKEKYFLVALEQDERSVDYKKLKTKYPLALVVGNEVSGVSKKACVLADEIIEIPMQGQKESLNVEVSFAVAIYRLLGL